MPVIKESMAPLSETKCDSGTSARAGVARKRVIKTTRVPSTLILLFILGAPSFEMVVVSWQWAASGYAS
jgi:hypothetical protein